jgi:hypothetical protein
LPNSDVSESTIVLPAVTLPRDSSRRDHWSMQKLGKFETWICVRCGYTEFYAYGPEDPEMLAKQFPEQLRIVDAEAPAQGPYR